MNDRPVIIAGLLLVLGVFTSPIWYNLVSGAGASAPQLTLPAKEKSCVAPRDYMRASHMALLVSWREDVVRRGARDFVTRDGRHYEKNLTATCLGCHESKKDFCDRCHDYAGVSPNCMDCHLERATGARGLKPGGPTPLAAAGAGATAQ